MSDVTIVGLGKMGAALAAALLDSGRSVTVWNRTAAKAKPLVEQGVVSTETAKAAIAASPVAITCLKNHQTTTELLRPISDGLAGRAIVDLSTGSADEAEELVQLLTGSDADWQIGMINAYPSGIGKAETAILCAGPRSVWQTHRETIRLLGGASDHVGTTASAIPGLFAAMFTARQGFMFGLIYGGAVCRRAGLPMEAFAAQIPVTLGMAGKYAETFMRTVPEQRYDDAGATVDVYRLALDDVLATFEATGTTDDFPRLMRDLVKRGAAEGLGEKELTALVELLSPNTPEPSRTR